MPFIACDLTSVYISFAILFCQKKVKKNCKYVVRVFFKKAGMSRNRNTESLHRTQGDESSVAGTGL